MKRLLLVLAFLFFAVPAIAQSTITCDKTAVISTSAGASGEIVALQTDATIYVCGFVLTADTLATTAVLSTGTGTTCLTGTVNLTGAMRFPDEGQIVFGNGSAVIMRGLLGRAFCITTVTGAVTGVLLYAQR